MSSSKYFFFFFSTLFFFSFPRISSRVTVCETLYCGGSWPPVRFPFRFKDQPESCGYAGFDLSCTNQNQTILTLPHSGDFVVQDIDYLEQTIDITDPDDCFFRRTLQNFTLRGSPFHTQFFGWNFTFFNCSSNVTNMSRSWPISCLGGHGFSVWMTPSDYREDSWPPPSCRATHTALLPEMSPSQSVQLSWSEPSCVECVARGGDCVRSDSSRDVECLINAPGSIGLFYSSKKNGGLPRSAKYGIIIGVGIPGLLCLIGLSCYLCGRIRVYRRRHNPNTQLTSINISPQRSVLAMGLDGPTIESYPKTLLGESRRLPKPSDNTCPICLSEYQPKEELRTIPECNHYFHVNCIDEWLKLNGTCPLCRNSPDGSALVTPSSLSSSSSTSLSPSL
ncbi:putative RING-H2 finger protein ATL21A isoform X1 [Corylus avellana]|uniref:putative RING-H2 finger protein ATL21A isoform X1 n=1 Tax=Corylus avellana TaxID=13451 RepID=UPI00286BEE63|nr:putative RING-H2 finger protein ATL21A isoform X1 [Corylus avellana]